jgi:hypothetical protein
VKRRSFFAALATAVAAPAVPRRVYSFLWDEPLVISPLEHQLRRAIKEMKEYVPQPDILIVAPCFFKRMKEMYPDDRVLADHNLPKNVSFRLQPHVAELLR